MTIGVRTSNIILEHTMFAFISMGGKVNTSINKGGGPYMFKMHGQNIIELVDYYHPMGSHQSLHNFMFMILKIRLPIGWMQ